MFIQHSGRIQAKTDKKDRQIDSQMFIDMYMHIIPYGIIDLHTHL